LKAEQGVVWKGVGERCMKGKLKGEGHDAISFCSAVHLAFAEKSRGGAGLVKDSMRSKGVGK